MSRTPAKFTVADLNRARQVAEKFAYPVAIEVAPDGTIRIVPVENSGHSGGKAETEVEDDLPTYI